MNAQIQDLVARKALFAVNHSGGKDSQAMLIKLLAIVPREQIIVVHADLGEVEWQGTQDHARQQAEAAGVPFIVAKARKADGSDRTFLNMVEDRFAKRPDAPSFPSPKYRQCTSDLKRGPLDREIFGYMRVNGLSLLVNCMGLRAQESSARSKLAPFKHNTDASKAGRECYDWLPIFELTTAQVFETISQAGQQAHWAYAAGNERLSCVFCIMGSPKDLANGARHNPELYARYLKLEADTGYTMFHKKGLAQLVAEGQALLG